ncbi:MAG: AAA family ATPase [Pseudomonadales bacterium]
MAIFEEVLEWAGSLHPWRQDALRRLCTQAGWSASDTDEILDLAKQHHGIDSAVEPAPQPIPLSPDDIPAEPTPGSTVTLDSLHSFCNVGKIPNDQALDLQTQGLNVVYGGNGAGKSSYARVLKQACRARSPEGIYANAYAPNFEELVPSATIEFKLQGANYQEHWSGRPGHIPRSELRGISVFDGECARQYLRSMEEAAFQPVALTYLQLLANGLKQTLIPRVQAEIDGLAVDTTPYQIIPADTEAGRAVHPITSQTDLRRARALALLTQGEHEELGRLPQEISEADPTARALNLEHVAKEIVALGDGMAVAASVVSADAIAAARSEYQRLLDAENAERAASRMLQSEDSINLLPGTGQGPWAHLFEAAREYSITAAYPGKEFPFTEDDSVCVLCQQEMTPAAKGRMERFDRYISDTAAEAARAARAAWKEIEVSIRQASVAFNVSEEVSELLGARLAELPSDIQTFQLELQSRLHWLRGAIESGDWHDVPEHTDIEPITATREIAESLFAEAAALRASIDEDALAAKRSRLRELEARESLSEHIDGIARVVGNLGHRERLENCRDDISNTRRISSFASSLARRYVSEALAERMSDELRRLDLYHIQVGISSSGDVGSVRLGIRLQGSQLAPHLVLSESEQRMCALAYFLAELHQSGSTSGVVFDDPVSSLDHNYRAAVSKRIVEESAHRQAVVFTHDAVFFGELRTLCDEAQVIPAVKSICHRAGEPGYIDAGLPYDMRKLRERIAEHRAEHERIAANFNNPPGEEERVAIRNAYDDLRVTIEVGIEDVILNETVVRFRDRVSVGRLDGVMAVQPDDFREVQRLHDKCCRNVRAHSHAAGRQRPVVQPSELLEDIEAVFRLFQGIRTRRG